MTQSLPAQVSWSPSRRDVVVNAAAGLTLRALPHIPKPVKRLLAGGRSVTIDGNTLDTTLQLMLTGQRMTGIDGLVNGDDVAAARGQLEALAAGFKKYIPVDAVTDLSIPGPAGDIRARHYRPVVGHGPLLVFFHGGGQVIGSIETHDDLCREICRRGRMHVLSVDYRLAPEHPAPAGTDDAYAAFRWAHEHAAELGADPDRVAVGGDSAGGNQATLVAHRARSGGPAPALQVLLYPVTNYRDETRSQTLFADGYFLTRDDLDWFRGKYLSGEIGPDDPRVSPLLSDDLSGLPPALVVTAGFDPLRDEGREYADAMRAAGVAVDHREFGSLIHGFANFFPFGGDSTTAMAEVISAMRAHLSGGP
ncbi:alpha/beta hydrolase [Mycobacterium sp. IDR2000157661]|uniref:alpha/beta hydrolase n=1 Tax=Mycobacterium sp. IDR2000157661 TaxID=2867005 RepID=UPI001EEA1B53|nr:alpha/beta hydrolase [Mycobacterium sp. IDR2000157661]ULE33164.1 alpha/beta hydrolase [Mycobacterium sp. IDR2000157661]